MYVYRQYSYLQASLDCYMHSLKQQLDRKNQLAVNSLSINDFLELSQLMTKVYLFFLYLAKIPEFMANSDRIVGGQFAPTNIPWQAQVHIGTSSYMGNKSHLFKPNLSGGIFPNKLIQTNISCL